MDEIETMSFPTADEARARLETVKLGDDKKYIDSVLEKIKTQIFDHPQDVMTVNFTRADFQDEDQCQRIMKHVNTVLGKKGFDRRCESRISTSPLGADYWSGATVTIRLWLEHHLNKT